MKKSVITFACLTLAAFTFFSCASKETDIPEGTLETVIPDDIDFSPEEEISEEEKPESEEEETSLISEDISEEENDEIQEPEVLDSNEVEELEEIIEPEIFEAELPPEEPELIPEEEIQIQDESSEPLSEEETSEIEELPEVIPEVIIEEEKTEPEKTSEPDEISTPEEISETEEINGKENDSSKVIDEVIEFSDDKVDEVESLEEASTDEESILSEEPVNENEIVPSRSVTLKKGETLEVSYPGKGWIFLGAADGSKNLTSTGRKTNAKTTDFSLMARVPGTVILHFYKEDILADKYIDDYLEVTVQDIKSKSTVHVKAPSYAEAVPAKPVTKTEPEQEVKKEEKVKEEIKPVIPVTEPEPAVKPVEPETSAEPELPAEIMEEEMPVLSADDYLSRAKKALDEKNYTEGYNNIQNFLLITEQNRDEGLFILAGIYEGNSEYRNIKKSVETYEELTNNYPLSKYWEDANKRIIYLKRFYINIR